LNYILERSILRPFPEGEGARAGGNTLVTFTITVAGLAYEPQKERDLSAVFIGDPSSGPQNVIGLADSLGSSARLADNR
jgi:hypothetical protein